MRALLCAVCVSCDTTERAKPEPSGAGEPRTAADHSPPDNREIPVKKNITVPEDLTLLSDEDLTSLGLQIREAAEALADEAATSDESLAEIERLVADFDRVNDELAARESKRTERAERAAAALSKFNGEVTDDAEEITTDEDDEIVAEEVEVAAAVEDEATEEASVEAEATEDDSTTEASTEVVEAPAQAEAETLATEESATIEEFATEADADTPSESSEFTTEVEVIEDTPNQSIARVPTVESLRERRPEGAAPRHEVVQAGAALIASNAVPGFSEGTALDRKALAAAIAKKRYGMTNTSAGTFERIVLATAQADLPNKIGGGAEENFETLENVRREWAQFRTEQTALVASGGCCVPLEPSYDFFRLAEPLNPVEQCLPTVEAPRGGIRFISPPDFRDAFGGVRITTCAEDEAGYPPTPPKPCVRVACPPVEECRVDAVSQCVEFGNLQYRTFPEQVESFLEDLAVVFTATKEIAYLDAIDGASTAVTTTPAYGAVRSTAQVILAAAAGYRRRNHMNPNAVLQIMLPSWLMEMLKVDLINDHSLGLTNWCATEEQINCFFGVNNLDVCWYYDSATGAGQGFDGAQVAGPLVDFPLSVVAYLYAPGTFVRLDGGTLDVGIVRDSILNGTNDLQIFSEQWVQVCMIGLESIRLTIPLCPDGTAPEPVPPLVCA